LKKLLENIYWEMLVFKIEAPSFASQLRKTGTQKSVYLLKNNKRCGILPIAIGRLECRKKKIMVW
tara:strand:- start:28 stop:222 length:195 start_codon:yes stop_codon:yes gene_type:complete